MTNTNYSNMRYRENIKNITLELKEIDRSDYHAIIANSLGLQGKRNITEEELMQAKLKKMAVSRILGT